VNVAFTIQAIIERHHINPALDRPVRGWRHVCRGCLSAQPTVLL
jgi:hypothetical protein